MPAEVDGVPVPGGVGGVQVPAEVDGVPGLVPAEVDGCGSSGSS